MEEYKLCNLLTKEGKRFNKSGVYLIINKIDDKKYVGSSIDIAFRITEHYHTLSLNKHFNPKLQNAVNKHGLENFYFTILEYVEILDSSQKSILYEREQYYMDLLDVIKDGYNINPVAGGNMLINISIPICQIDLLTGEVVNYFTSIKEASMFMIEQGEKLDLNRNGIYACSAGSQKSAYGYGWIRHNTDSIKKDIKNFIEEYHKKSTFIEKINLITGEIEIFESVMIAAQSVNSTRDGSVAHCLLGRQKTSHGFKWRRFKTKFEEDFQPEYYLGIDVGLHGCFSLIKEDKSEIYTFPTPLLNKEIDIQRLNKFLKYWSKYIKYCVIEDIHSLPVVGAKSNFTFGFVDGVTESLIIANDIPFTKVTSKNWQKQMFQGIVPIHKIGTTKIDTKAVSIIAAKNMFPKIKLTTTPRETKEKDGISDSLLIAEYCRRNFRQ